MHPCYTTFVLLSYGKLNVVAPLLRMWLVADANLGPGAMKGLVIGNAIYSGDGGFESRLNCDLP